MSGYGFSVGSSGYYDEDRLVNWQRTDTNLIVARHSVSGLAAADHNQDGQQTIADYPSGTVAGSPTYTYVYASYIDEPVMRGDSGGLRYYHRNQQYSITAISDGGGAIVERYAYSAYGQVTIAGASGSVISDSAIANRYTYTGREWDEGLSLFHYRARMYDSVGGRFVSRDPIGYIDGSSLYAGYFAPNMLDPTGQWYWTDRNGDYCGPYVQLYAGSWCVKPNVWEAAMEAAGDFLNCWADCEIETHQNITTYISGTVASTTGWINIERIRWVAKTAEEIKKGSVVGPQQTHTSILSRLANWLKNNEHKRAARVLRYHQRFTKTAPLRAGVRTCLIGVVITETAISLNCSWKCS